MMRQQKLLMKTEKQLLALISQEIKKAKKILVAGHRQPDFDSAGAVFGLASALEKMHKQVFVSVNELKAKQEKVFKHIKAYKKDSFGKPDLVIMLDYGSVRMLNQKVVKICQKRGVKVITIDHHQLQDQFGDLVWLDNKKVAASEMVFDLLRFMKSEIDEKTDFCLLLGMISDSGLFAYSQSASKLLKKIAKLKISDRNLALAFKTVSSFDSFGDFQRFSEVGSRIKFDEKLNLAYAVIEKNYSIAGLTSFLANKLLLVEGVDYILIIRRQPDRSYYGSLRSSIFSEKQIDVSQIASSFESGGGHFNSAGFKTHLSSGKIIAKVKAEIRKQLKSA